MSTFVREAKLFDIGMKIYEFKLGKNLQSLFVHSYKKGIITVSPSLFCTSLTEFAETIHNCFKSNFFEKAVRKI